MLTNKMLDYPDVAGALDGMTKRSKGNSENLTRHIMTILKVINSWRKMNTRISIMMHQTPAKGQKNPVVEKETLS